MRPYAPVKFPKHWTPRYVLARGVEILDHSLRPEDPWLTREAVDLLARLLRPADTALEFGAGRSTVWFAARVHHLTSIESDEQWYLSVAGRLRDKGITNVDLRYCPSEIPDDGTSIAPSYERVLAEMPDEGLDFVLIDSIYRNQCALRSVPKVRPGGMIVIDNVGRYLPSTTHSPAARTLADGPADDVWQEFADATAHWRRIWTTSNVTDTLLLFKP